MFDAACHIQQSQVQEECDASGNIIFSFQLPRTKVAVTGETVSCALRPGNLADPQAALDAHYALNAPGKDGHLFAYQDRCGNITNMSKQRFLTTLKRKCEALGEVMPQGHALRIGSTLELLLAGVPFEVVKTKGR